MSSIIFQAELDQHPSSVVPSVSVRGSRFLRYLLIGLDAFALTIAWTIAVLVASSGTRSVGASIAEIALIAGSVAFFDVIGLHRSRVCTVRVLEYERLARGCLGVALVALALGAVTAAMPSPGEIVFGTSLSFLFVVATRSWYRAWLTNRRRIGDYLRPVLIVGAGSEAAGIAALLTEHPELGYRTAAVAGDELEARRNGLADYWYSDLDGARHAAGRAPDQRSHHLRASDLGTTRLNQTVQQFLDARAHVQLSSGLHGIDISRLRPSPLAHEPLFYVEHVTLASWQLATKRCIDLLLASLLLIVTSPLVALAAIGIKFQDHGPVLFKQWRIGRGGKPFVLYKLRTMREGADRESADLFELNARDGPLVKIRDDPRVTVFGRVLRATSIDELPQLWNVLNGTMSLVGPRPALADEVVHFDAELRARESVLPGITGLWQVEGRDNPSFAAYRRFDLFYLQNWTVTLDLMILLGTVESVLTRVFRGLLHLGEDISLAPPEVKDPAAQARRLLEPSVREIRREP